MKKIIVLCTAIFLIFIAGCSSQSNLDCGEYKNGESWQVDCNTCSCSKGNITCTEIACNNDDNSTILDEIKDEINAWKFNADLTDYEQEWLSYLENKYPNTRIILIKTEVYSCDGCYDLYFKKDRDIVKIKVLNGELKQESVVNDDIVTLIENKEICQVFSGEWNECPRPCTTDEAACDTQCNPPVCEFNENLIVYKTQGEECGGLDKGDCAFGLTCYYANKEDVYGICQAK